MEIKYIQTFGWENAIRGMRYSFNSEKRADSIFQAHHDENGISIVPFLGEEDFKLIKRLVKAGAEHRKFLRAIHVQMSINATMTFWKQFDTYKISTTALSRSTMHTLMKEPLMLETNFDSFNNSEVLKDIVNYINELIYNYNEEAEKPSNNPDEMERLFFEVVDILPMSYLQERMVDLNYENILNIIKQRMSHKLKHEWKVLCEELLETLPYLKDLYDVLKEK